MIFTLNASNAIKIVGQNYPFENGQVLLLSENHNSISGLREYAMKAGASVCYLPVTAPELRASDKSLLLHLDTPSVEGRRLFAYAAQSNFSGVQHPLGMLSVLAGKYLSFLCSFYIYAFFRDDLPGPEQGLGGASGCRGPCTDQRPGPQPVAARLRGPFVLQDVWAAHGGRGPPGAQGQDPPAAPHGLLPGPCGIRWRWAPNAGTLNRETIPWKSRYVTREGGLDLPFLLLSPPVPMRRFGALQDLGGRILRGTRGPLALPEELENSGLVPLRRARAGVRGAALAM